VHRLWFCGHSLTGASIWAAIHVFARLSVCFFMYLILNFVTVVKVPNQYAMTIMHIFFCYYDYFRFKTM